MSKNKIKSAGFSLIELSVVLVVIGLIVGGVMVGTSMVRSSKLQSVIADATRYTQAINAFRDKYYALPGDFKTATSIWGAADAVPATCITVSSPSNAVVTCNGDGNGRVVNIDSYAATYYEQFRAWQHLSNAKLIEGKFSGISTSGTYEYTIGVNIPASRLDGAGWRMINISAYDITSGATATLFYTNGDIPPNLVLWIGGNYSAAASPRMTGVLSPQEAYQLDLKTDDGNPFTGRWIAQRSTGFTSSCTNGDTAASLYNTSTTSNAACALVFKTGL